MSFDSDLSPAPRWTAVLVILVPFVLAIGLSVPFLGNDFIMDDVGIVRDNARLTPLSRAPKLLGETYWGDVAESHLYRPLTLLTFAVERAAWGVEAARPYRVANAVLYGLCAALVGLVALRLRLGWLAALVAGVLFAVHPIHIEPLATVVGRSELGSALFGLLALWFALGRAGAFSGVLVGLAVFAGLLCKEGVIAIVPVLAVLPAFRRDSPGPLLRAIVHGLRARLVMWIAILIALGAWYALRSSAIHDQTHIVGPMDNVLHERGALARMAGGFEVSLRYVRMTLWPWPQSADYSKAAIDPASTIVALRPILGAILWLAILGGPFLARRRVPIVGLGVLFFALALLPVANLLMPIGTIFGERLLFLPSVGACLGLAAVAAGPLAAGAGGRWGVGVAMAAIVAASAWAFVERAPDWQDELAVSRAIVREQPESAKGRTKLGTALAQRAVSARGADRRRLLREAEEHLQRAIEIHPDGFGAHHQLCLLYENTGRMAEAGRESRALMRLAPENPAALAARARAHGRDGSRVEAIALYDRAIERHPDSIVLVLGRAEQRMRLQRSAEAAADYARALELAPWHPEIYANYVQALFDAGDLAGARAALDRQLALEPSHPAFPQTRPLFPHLLGQRGHIRSLQDDGAGAITDFTAALELQPELTRARRSRATLLIAAGRFTEAEADLRVLAAAEGDAAVAELRRMLEQTRRILGGG